MAIKLAISIENENIIVLAIGYCDSTHNMVNCKFPYITLSTDDYSHKQIILG